MNHNKWGMSASLYRLFQLTFTLGKTTYWKTWSLNNQLLCIFFYQHPACSNDRLFPRGLMFSQPKSIKVRAIIDSGAIITVKMKTK